MAARTLLATRLTDNGYVYEVWYDFTAVTDNDGIGSGGITRNGEDLAGFWIEKGALVDYDGVYELSHNAIAALKQAGFTVSDEFNPK